MPTLHPLPGYIWEYFQYTMLDDTPLFQYFHGFLSHLNKISDPYHHLCSLHITCIICSYHSPFWPLNSSNTTLFPLFQYTIICCTIWLLHWCFLWSWMTFKGCVLLILVLIQYWLLRKQPNVVHHLPRCYYVTFLYL